MGQSLADIAVSLSLDLSDFAGRMNDAERRVDKFVNDTATKTGDLRNVGLGLAGVGAAIGLFLAQSVRDAAEAQRSQALLAEAIAASSHAADLSIEAFNQQAAALQRMTTVGDESINSVQRLLVTFSLTQKQVEQLTPRVLNLAAQFGVDLESAALAVGKAFTVGTSALRRFGVTIDENIDPTREFDKVLAALDANTGDAARALQATLPGAVQALGNIAGDVREKIGAPILAILQAIVTAGIKILGPFDQLLAKFPGIATGIAGLLSLLGALAAAGGGILLAQSSLAATAAAARVVAAVFAGLVARIPSLIASLFSLAGAARIAGGALRASFAGLIGLLVGEAISDFQRFRANFEGTLVFVTGLLVEWAEGVARIIAGALTFDLRTVEQGTAQLRNSFTVAGFAAGEVRQQFLGVSDAADKVRKSNEGALLTFQQLRREIDATTSAQLRASQAETTSQLSAPGLDEARLEAIQAAQARRESEIQAGRLQRTIAAIEAELAAERQGADEQIKLREEVEEARAQLATLQLRQAEAVAQRDVEIARAAASTKLDIEKRTAEQRAEIASVRGAASQELVRLDREIADQRREAVLAATRLQEETRLELLRQSLTIERQLADDALAIREAGARAATTAEARELAARNRQRAELVRAGVLSEEEARRRGELDTDAVDQQRIARLRGIEQQRLQLIEAEGQRARQLAEAEAQTRVAVLEAETAARVAAVQSARALRESELRATLAALEAETEARVEAIRIETRERQAALIRKTQLDRELGTITAAEAQRRIDAVNAANQVEAQLARQNRDALVRVFEIRRAATESQLATIAAATQQQIVAISQESAARRQQIEQQLAGQLQVIDSGIIRNRAETAARLAELVSEPISDRSVDGQLRQIERVGDAIEGTVQRVVDPRRWVSPIVTGIGDLARAVERAADRADRALAVVVDGMRQRIEETALVMERFAPDGFGAGQLARAAPPPAVTTAAVTPSAAAPIVIQVAGVDVQLTPDEQALAARMFARFVGPEGARLLDDAARRLPGQRVGAFA